MLYVLLIISILMPIIFVAFVILKNSKYRTYFPNALLLVILFVLSFLIFIISSSGYYHNGFDNLFNAVSSSIGMFAMTNELSNLHIEAFNPPFLETVLKVTIIYIDQLVCLASLSLVILTAFVKTMKAKMRNIFKAFNALPYMFGKKNQKRCVKSVVFTDLPYDDIGYFLEKLKNTPKMQLKVVVLSSSTKTERGQFLTDVLKLHEYDVCNEYLSVPFLKKITRSFRGKVNVYSLFYRDYDNLEFASLALEFSKLKSIKKKINRQLINFYVSYQDESFNSKIDFDKESKGMIQLVNEYSWTATKFVFFNPLTRFLDLGRIEENKKDFFGNIAYPPQLHVHFFGFGKIGNAVLKKMFPNYQLPYKDKKVIYHILDLDGQNKRNSFISQFDSFSTYFNNTKDFLPQRNFEKAFFGYDIGLENDKEIRDYLMENVVPSLRENHQHVVIIALGDSFKNISLALKLRQILKNYLSSFRINVKEKNEKKSLIIYPYIKESNVFVPNNIYFGMLMKEMMMKAHYVPSADEFVDALSSKEEHRNNEKTFSYRNDYEASRLYIFDVNTEEINPKKLFTKKDNYRYFTKNYTKAEQRHFFKHFRRATFILESIPIVAFGRGGYQRDELSDSLRDLAAMENYSYLTKEQQLDKKKQYHIDDDYHLAVTLWNEELNYSMKESNIGSILSLPYKLGLFGYKLKFSEGDKDDFKYKNRSNNMLDLIARRLNEKINNQFKDDFIYKVTSYQNVFTSYFNLYLENKRIDENISYSKLKKYLIEYYHNQINDESLIDAYNLMYGIVLENDYLVKIIRNIEHNRWYVLNASNGIVPLSKKEIEKGLRKSKDGLRNHCMTTNEGLNDIIKLKITHYKNNNSFNKYQSLEELIVAFEKDQQNPFRAIYKDVFYNDISSLISLKEKFAIGDKQKIFYYLKYKGITCEAQKYISSLNLILFVKQIIKENLDKNLNFALLGDSQNNLFLMKYLLSIQGGDVIYYQGEILEKEIAKLDKINSLIDIKYQKITSLNELENINNLIVIYNGDLLLKTLLEKYRAYNSDEIEIYLNDRLNQKLNDSKDNYLIREVLNSKKENIDDFAIDFSVNKLHFAPKNDLDFHYLNSNALNLSMAKYLLNNEIDTDSLLNNFLNLKGKKLYEFIFEQYQNHSFFHYFCHQEHIRWMIRTLLFDEENIYQKKKHLFVSFDDLYVHLTKDNHTLNQYYQKDILIYDALNVIANLYLLKKGK